MSDVTTPPLEVQAFYSTLTGMLIREDGKTRPGTLDEIEQKFCQAVLDDVMSMPGHWHDLTVPTRSYRCWTRRRNMDVAVIFVPGFGKVEANLHLLPSAALFNRICDAEMLAWRKPLTDPSRGKAFVDLSDRELETLKNAMQPLALKPITRLVQPVNLGAFNNPPDRPAA